MFRFSSLRNRGVRSLSWLISVAGARLWCCLERAGCDLYVVDLAYPLQSSSLWLYLGPAPTETLSFTKNNE